MPNKPINQHDLPATYLRRFSSDPGDRRKRNMIWCLRNEHAKILVEEKSVHSRVFTMENFYTIDDENDPFKIEHFFRKDVEPRYEHIITEISGEGDLSKDCRINLIIWLHFNKIRNRHFPNNIQQKRDEETMVDFVARYGLKEYNRLLKNFQQANEIHAKEAQINALSNTENMGQFERHLKAKHWLILKSRENMPFLANENPGFSINMSDGSFEWASLSNSFATHAAASNYFILSPRYCLLASPFYAGTPVEINADNQKIEFLTCGVDMTEFINFCTIQTFKKYLISNRQQFLEDTRAFLVRIKNEK